MLFLHAEMRNSRLLHSGARHTVMLMAAQSEVLSVPETAEIIAGDRNELVRELESRPTDSWTDPYRVNGGPLGDFCESLHDLLAHVLMWDEINLAFLTDAMRHRTHWSLAAEWETPEMGRLLNAAGVLAGRRLPSASLLSRFVSVRDALLDELRHITDRQWREPVAVSHDHAGSLGELAANAMTVPRADPYVHALLHLGRARKRV
jgi:hypothetical protein